MLLKVFEVPDPKARLSHNNAGAKVTQVFGSGPQQFDALSISRLLNISG